MIMRHISRMYAIWDPCWITSCVCGSWLCGLSDWFRSITSIACSIVHSTASASSTTTSTVTSTFISVIILTSVRLTVRIMPSLICRMASTASMGAICFLFPFGICRCHWCKRRRCVILWWFGNDQVRNTCVENPSHYYGVSLLVFQMYASIHNLLHDVFLAFEPRSSLLQLLTQPYDTIRVFHNCFLRFHLYFW